ncbi:response regulator [Candidatus Sumerlaeota bacterium]|nr:response regulator [Candidatus Sumerlaeota bacterium]
MSSSPQHRHRILALDDNADILDLIQLTLSDKYDVVTLRDAVSIYEIMDAFDPDLLIMDVMMPKVNGYQLTEMLRKNAATKDLPIIILSAKASQGEIKHGYKLGATLYLTKPFEPERLLKNVETQFRVQPPASAKAHKIHDVAEAIENTSSFRKGLVRLSDSIERKEHNIDPRRKLTERLLEEEKRLKKLD